MKNLVFHHFRYGGTIAVQKREDSTVHIGFAFMSPKDQLNKSRGRQISAGRLEKEGNYTALYVPNDEFESAVQRLHQLDLRLAKAAKDGFPVTTLKKNGVRFLKKMYEDLVTY